MFNVSSWFSEQLQWFSTALLEILCKFKFCCFQISNNYIKSVSVKNRKKIIIINAGKCYKWYRKHLKFNVRISGYTILSCWYNAVFVLSYLRQMDSLVFYYINTTLYDSRANIHYKYTDCILKICVNLATI